MSNDQSDPAQTGSTNATQSVQDQVRKIIQRLNDLMELLRSQRELLKQRGMNLPSGSLDNLRTLKKRVDGLSKQLINAQVELRQLRALAETTSLINSALETDAVLEQVMDTVISLTGAERGYIVMKNRDTGELDQFRVARGIDEYQLAGSSRSDDPGERRNEFIVSRTIVNEVASTGEPVLTDNASTDERYQGQQSIVGFALRSILAVPLIVRSEVIGVVYCDNRVLSGLFQAHDRDILAAFANQAGVAIENARLFEEARAQLQYVTEMRDLMNNIFNSIISAVITTDMNGGILTYNEAAQRILGGGELDNKSLRDVLPHLDDAFFESLSAVISSDKQQILAVDPVVPSLGKRHWNVIASPLRDVDGVGHGLAIVLDDLTDQKQRESQLVEVRRYLPLALVENIRSMEDVNIQGQERTITVIACDVRGFTTFSERLQPEELMETINKYLSLASDAINLYEGIVDKYMGDAVTGLFNTQLNPQSDHAMRAVRAAMSIIYDLYALHEVLPEDQRLFYGIGIHTGPAFLGNVGGADRREFSALGEAATVSKILEGNAKAGEIIISQATYDIVGDFFECEARTPDKAKGREDLKQVYKVIKRRKGAQTGQLFVDPELADLLKDLDSNNE